MLKKCDKPDLEKINPEEIDHDVILKDIMEGKREI